MIFQQYHQLLDHKFQFVGIILLMNYYLIQMHLQMAQRHYLRLRLVGIINQDK